MATKSKVRTKASKIAGKVPSASKTWMKRSLYFALAAVPLLLIFKNKTAVAAAAAIAYDHLSDAGEIIVEQAEMLVDKVKDLEIV